MKISFTNPIFTTYCIIITSKSKYTIKETTHGKLSTLMHISSVQ